MGRILFFKADDNACGYYRCELPAQALREKGHEIEVRVLIAWRVGSRHYLPLDGEWDAVIWQRPTNPAFLEIARQLSRQMKLYIEIDDALDAMPPDNPFLRIMYLRGERPAYMFAVMREAHGVIVSTPGLAERYSQFNKNIHVCENCVRLDDWQPKETPNERPIVGWAGSNTHGQDIREMVGWIEPPIRRHNARFVLLGGEYNDIFGCDAEHIPWSPLNEYRQNLASFDIGLAPLADNKFNECKSWLRPLELMACGVPVIASNAREYARIISHGETSLLVRKPRDWQKHLDYLLAHPKEREEMGARAREAAKKYSVEANIWKWEEALELTG